MSAAGLRGTLACALALAAAPAAEAQGREFARVGSRELPRDLKPDTAARADLGGDGTLDLVVGAHGRGPGSPRVLLVFRTGSGVQLSEPTRFDLTPDVIAWVPGDVHADAGDELVLFTPAGAFCLRPLAAEDERFARLFPCDFLWQIHDGGTAFLYAPALRDVDGDGLDDLVVPEPSGYRVALQDRDEGGARFERVHAVRVPPEPADWEGLGPELAGGAAVRGGSRGTGVSVSVSLSGESESEGEASTLLALVESTPAPQWIDWNADGRLDLLAQTTERLHLWRQDTGGVFPAQPTASFPLPVVADRTRRLDASYVAFLRDVDGDRRGDCTIFAGDQKAKDVRTQLLAFTSARAEPSSGPRNPFGARGRPQDVLVMGGFVAKAALEDLDGDGLPEIVARTIRPDLIDQLRSAASETLEADLFVYANTGGRFARRPTLAWRYTVPFAKFLPEVEFIGDVTGDGLSDLYVRDRPDRARLLTLRRQKEGWSILERPLWEAALDPDATVWLLSAEGRPADDLAVLEPTRVRLVRFGP